MPLRQFMATLAQGECEVESLLGLVCFRLGLGLQQDLGCEYVALLQGGHDNPCPEGHLQFVEAGDMTRRQLEHSLCRYQAYMLCEMEKSKDIVSVAVDASMVGGRSRLFGAATLPDNQGFVLPPQAAS